MVGPIEARNHNGEYYSGGICAGIQRHIREKRIESNGQAIDIYKDPDFAYFRKAFDSTLKCLHRQGIGTSRKQAKVISEDLEERLWTENVLGDDTPERLLNTLVYCFGLQFALRSGQEHRRLRPDMLQLVDVPGCKPYLSYVESGSKNNSGGLNERHLKNKSVKVFANEVNPDRCVIRLYKKYMALRPQVASADVFYLQPLKIARKDCWYQLRPVGHNTLSNTVKKLCGKYTNHSLRRTRATRLFQKGVDEHQIMSITGHRSVNGVRVYKETSLQQEENLSDLLQVNK